ncbi:MAG: dihydrodipicolinate synthase family protein [Actinobacteria bacterium]|nr:dihydrodipicolinate synthase family protein [Actinomycetota bacterium]
MDRDDVEWRGYWPACPTPFAEDGSYDAAEHRALIDWYAGEGMHGVFINGTSGEWFSQSSEERRQVAENAIDAAAGRMTVVVGCTSYTAREAAELGRHALAAGAEGIGSTPPPYSKTYPDETVRYYSDLAGAVDGPVMIYNWPHGTNVDIDADLAERLVEIENVVAIKDSTPNFEQFAETARRIVDRARVIGPFMSEAGLDLLLEVGGDGFIGGGTLWGRPDAEFWEAVWRGDVELAREHARRTEELFPKLWLPGGWGGHYGAYQSQLKALMRLLGQPGGVTVRPPRLPVTDEASIAAMRDVLLEAGLLEHPAEVA